VPTTRNDEEQIARAKYAADRVEAAVREQIAHQIHLQTSRVLKAREGDTKVRLAQLAALDFAARIARGDT